MSMELYHSIILLFRLSSPTHIDFFSLYLSAIPFHFCADAEKLKLHLKWPTLPLQNEDKKTWRTRTMQACVHIPISDYSSSLKRDGFRTCSMITQVCWWIAITGAHVTPGQVWWMLYWRLICRGVPGVTTTIANI